MGLPVIDPAVHVGVNKGVLSGTLVHASHDLIIVTNCWTSRGPLEFCFDERIKTAEVIVSLTSHDLGRWTWKCTVNGN